MFKRSLLGSCLFLVCAVSASAQSVSDYYPGDNYISRPRANGPNPTYGTNPKRVYMEVYTPQRIAAEIQMREIEKCNNDGYSALQTGNSIGAEIQFRNALIMDEDYTPTYEGLALALIAQKKTADAIRVYRKIFYDISLRGMQFDDPVKTREYREKVYQNPVAYGGSGSASCWEGLRYALLLNETGQWAEAVRVYESALPLLPGGTLPKIAIHFDQNIPQPTDLEAATNIAMGLQDNFFGRQDVAYNKQRLQAMQEYTRALQLRPDWEAANYYYGFGWHLLSPAEQAKFGTAAQAKASL